jgi:serine phosphatase RsbU (regulator of sigma subunit)
MNETMLIIGGAIIGFSMVSYSGIFPDLPRKREFILLFMSGLYFISTLSATQPVFRVNDLPGTLIIAFHLLFFIYQIHVFVKWDKSVLVQVSVWFFVVSGLAVDIFNPKLGYLPALVLLLVLFLRYSVMINEFIMMIITHRNRIRILRRKIRTEETEIHHFRERFENRLKSLNEEMIIARDIQKALIPSLSQRIDHVSIEGHYEFRESTGGDYFDIARTPDGGIAVITGDVSGAGVSAGLVMTIAKLSFAKALKKTSSPAEAFSIVNDEIFTMLRFEQYLSAFLAVFYKNGDVVYSNAGHPAPLIIRKNPSNEYSSSSPVQYSRLGMEEWGLTGGLFLGSMKSEYQNYHDRKTRLFPGDRVLFYTDGYINQLSPENVPLADTLWEKSVITPENQTLEECRTSLIYTFNEHRRSSPLIDDMMFILAEYQPVF